jgi:tRNA pseudouridine38-40 synthase
LVVSRVDLVTQSFHARYDALWREYRYRIHIAPAPPAMDRRFAWWRWRELDANLASAACSRLIGRHHFGSFAGMGKSRSRDAGILERQVRECIWRCDAIESDRALSGAVECRHELRIVADGYLPRMVRNIVGAIRVVAEGERSADWIDELLEVRNRSALGEAAPPEGLVLWRITYADDSEQGESIGARVVEEG